MSCPLLDESIFFPPGIAVDKEDILKAQQFAKVFLPFAADFLQTLGSASGQETGLTSSGDENEFQANVDVQHFKPEEISVLVTGENTVIVEAKHEERQDEQGSISRQFIRRFVLPGTYDINRVESKLSSDGVLTITAPKIDQEIKEVKQIPVIQTWAPAKKVEDKQED